MVAAFTALGNAPNKKSTTALELGIVVDSAYCNLSR